MKKQVLPKSKQTNYEDWFASLPLDKQMYVAQHVKKKLDKIQYDTEQILDSCYMGAMIETLEMNLDDCIKIAEKANVNMRITEQILNKEGEGYYMKVNNEELRKQIRLEAKEMLKNNPKESTIAISKELEKEYKMPVKDLHILVAEARKELKAEKKEIPSNATGAIEASLMLEGEHGFEIVSDEPGIKINTDIFKIKSIELEGKFGTYLKGTEGVKLGDKLYKDITDVKHAREVLQSTTQATEDNINKKIIELTKELEETRSKKKQESEKYAEIEQIFAM